MEFDSTILYAGLILFSILAIFLAYRILFPPLCLKGMVVYEAQEYMTKKGKSLGVKVGFVQPTKSQFMYLGTICSHSYNPVTKAEDYVLYQIDMPSVPKFQSVPLREPIPEPIVSIQEPTPETIPEPITPIPEPITPIPEPITPIPEPIAPIPEPIKKSSRTKVTNSFKGNYFWS